MDNNGLGTEYHQGKRRGTPGIVGKEKGGRKLPYIPFLPFLLRALGLEATKSCIHLSLIIFNDLKFWERNETPFLFPGGWSGGREGSSTSDSVPDSPFKKKKAIRFQAKMSIKTIRRIGINCISTSFP